MPDGVHSPIVTFCARFIPINLYFSLMPVTLLPKNRSPSYSLWEQDQDSGCLKSYYSVIAGKHPASVRIILCTGTFTDVSSYDLVSIWDMCGLWWGLKWSHSLLTPSVAYEGWNVACAISSLLTPLDQDFSKKSSFYLRHLSCSDDARMQADANSSLLTPLLQGTPAFQTPLSSPHIPDSPQNW